MNARWLIFAVSLAAAAQAQPSLEIVDGTKIEFGSVSRGTVAERKVTLRNTGSDTLVISRVDASCGCTGTLMSDQRIPPGGTGSLRISFNSRNFSGPVHKTVSVHSNTFDGKVAVIEFTANVVEEIVLEPPTFWFRDARVGTVSTSTIQIRNQSRTVLKLTGVKTQLEGFTVRLPSEAIEPGKSAQIVAEYKPAAARQILSDGVFITTSSASQPQLYVQIYGNVKEFKFE